MRARVAVAILLGFALIAAGAAYLVSSLSTGTLAIQVHDAPASWSHVVITFSEVRVRAEGSSAATAWVPVALQETRIDFLDPGNLTHLLALDRIAPGSYAEVRLLISSVSGVLQSGLPVVMSVPNGLLTVNAAFLLRGGTTTTLTLDLNLAQSIQQTSLGWVFTPVLGSVEVG